MPDQSGTKPPFATTDGKPVDVSESGTPTDLVKDANSKSAKGGEFDVTKQSRLQPTTPPGQPPTPVHLQNRPQTPGSAAQRVNPESIPKGPTGGTTTPTPTVQPTGAGSVGNARPPFKGMK